MGLLAAILVALMVAIVMLGALLWTATHPPSAALPVAPVASQTAEAPPSPAPRADYMHWAGSPIIAAVGGDETEDIVGRISTSGFLEAGSQPGYFVAAFDGADFSPLWRAGPLGFPGMGDHLPSLAMVGGHVVASEHATAHVYALFTGKEMSAIKLTDRIVDACAPPHQDTEIWLEVADAQNVLLNVITGQTTPAEAPEACKAARAKAKLAVLQPPGSGPPKDGPTVAGLLGRRVLVDGDDAVMIGARAVGTPIAIAVGFDPHDKEKKPRWQHVVADADDPTTIAEGRYPADLIAGRLYATYGLTSAVPSITAIEARTGDRLWAVELPNLAPSPGTFVASSTRLYFAHFTWLETFDLATGRYLGTIGPPGR